MSVELADCAGGVSIPVKVRAAARRTGVVGEHDGALRIEVAVAPEKGKANDAVIALLAKSFHVPKSSIELIRGATSSSKIVLIKGATAEGLRPLLEGLLEK